MTGKDNILRMEQERFENLRDGKTEELSPVDRAIIGGSSARLDIPLTATRDLRHLPELLRGLATYMEFTMSRKELSEREKLTAIGTEARATRLRIREIAGLSKFNKNGSVRRG